MRPRFDLIFGVSILLLACAVNGQSSVEESPADGPTTSDESPPPFGEVGVHPAVSPHPPPTSLRIEPIKSASFSDENQGKIVWRIERTQLPWRGSYSFLSKPDPDHHPVVLLSVMDANTGLKVAECQTPVTRSMHTGWREELERSFHWHRVNWELDDEALQCNTTADLKSIRSAIQSTDSEAFVVRISASKGPRCIRNLYADEEEWAGCPPKMRMHAFHAEHLKCGCGDGGGSAEASAVPVEEPVVAAIEEPLLSTEEPPVFGNVRRKPLPARPSSVGPPSVPEEIGPASSPEIGAPAFPMFQFTSSMEKSESTDTTADPISSTTTEPSNPETPQATDETDTTPDSKVSTTSITDDQANVTPASALDEPETSAASCESYECQNNGTCVENSKGKPECNCGEGFGGAHCEKDLCAELGCQNGGKCQVRNGRAVCSCPHGLHGEKCHQVQQPTCNPKCENGGVCSLARGQPVCQCPHGFLGTNCNLRDLCAVNTTCEIYGPQARCFKETADLFRYSGSLQDGTYSCQCPSATGYVECNATMASQSAEHTPTPASSPSIFAHRSAQRAGNLENRSENVAASSLEGGDTSSASGPPPSQSSEQTATSIVGAEFPMHASGLGENRPTIQRIVGTRPAETPSPQFPITSLSTGASSASASTTRILPRPSTPRVGGGSSAGVEFTRLPATHLQSTTPTTSSAAASETSPEDEQEGDNGFERLTQIVEETTASATSAAVSSEAASTLGGGDSSVQPELGPKHSIEAGGAGSEENEPQPEFHTAPGGGFATETSTITTTLITAKNPPNDLLAEENAAEPRAGNDVGRNWTWIIALAVVGALLISATIGGVFMGRYVRRSRRLHGKYNPAREENSAVPTTYALPMTSVNKDERLI